MLWLAPRLEAAGYAVFADMLTLSPGDRWRKVVTGTLQDKAVKMLLCCRDSTLAKDGVQEEIGIAEDLVRSLDDPRFIIPLRLEPFKKVFGIGGLQYVDFVGSWARGLHNLLAAIEKQDIPRDTTKITINPNWEAYKKRLSIKIENAPEILTSNWLQITEMPDVIRYYQPSGVVNHSLLASACNSSPCPAEIYMRGFFSFAHPEEIKTDFSCVGKFTVGSELSLTEFLDDGSVTPKVPPREARSLVLSMFRKAWENLCREQKLYEYAFSKHLSFHVNQEHLPLGKRIPWGHPSQRRNSMLRNVARGKVWQYGVSAMPSLWPHPHFKLKSRVLFAELAGKEVGEIYRDTDQQHRLRRSVCSGWRNKAWHGRLMAFLKLLSDDSAFVDLPVSRTALLRLNAEPMQVTSPVSTALPDVTDTEVEEQDPSTLGNYVVEEIE